MNEYFFILQTLFSDLEYEYEREVGSVLTKKVSLVLTDSLQKTAGARVLSRFARGEIWEMRRGHWATL